MGGLLREEWREGGSQEGFPGDHQQNTLSGKILCLGVYGEDKGYVQCKTCDPGNGIEQGRPGFFPLSGFERDANQGEVEVHRDVLQYVQERNRGEH